MTSGTTFSHGFYELMDSYDGFIMDQWGVLHNGVEPCDGAINCLNHLKTEKKQVIILSNSSRRSEENAERMKTFGIKRALYKDVVTAGEVAWNGLKEQKEPPFKGLGRSCYLISRGDDRSLLQGLDMDVVDAIEDASFILLTSFDPVKNKIESFDPLFKKATAKRLHLICANPDMVTVYGAERAPGPGALAKRYQELGGAAHFIGKPHKAIFRYALSLFDGIIPSRVLVVGDSIQHDIAGGAGVSVDTAFITSGIHASAFKPSMSHDQKRKMVDHLCQGFGDMRPTLVLDGLIWQTAEAALRERERAKMKE